MHKHEDRLEALIQSELLTQEAQQRGIDRDPRVCNVRCNKF